MEEISKYFVNPGDKKVIWDHFYWFLHLEMFTHEQMFFGDENIKLRSHILFMT